MSQVGDLQRALSLKVWNCPALCPNQRGSELDPRKDRNVAEDEGCLKGGSPEMLVSADPPRHHDHSHNDQVSFELPLPPSSWWHAFYEEAGSGAHTISGDSTERVSLAIFHQGDRS